MPKGIYKRGKNHREPVVRTQDTSSPPQEKPPVVTTEDAPESVVNAGDVFRGAGGVWVVVTAIDKKFDVAHTYQTPNLWEVKNTPWEGLDKGSRHIALSTCDHHINIGNWKFAENVAGLWGK